MRLWLWALLLLLVAAPVRAQDLPQTHLKVVGGLGQTVQYKQFEAPFWSKELTAASNGRITAVRRRSHRCCKCSMQCIAPVYQHRRWWCIVVRDVAGRVPSLHFILSICKC